jgi:hypothetical protein
VPSDSGESIVRLSLGGRDVIAQFSDIIITYGSTSIID